MFNNLKNIWIGILSAVIVIAIGVSTYTAFASAGTGPITTTGTTTVNYGNSNNGSGTSVLAIPASNLNAEESDSLLYMREEEKLARDVYTALYTVWAQPAFQNIAASEQYHMDQIKLLLDRYALTDPALAPGQFTDPTLQELYNQLIAQGNLSLADALKVGAAIEEIDIRDLQTRSEQTDNTDVQLVYNNLMNGSYNHLKAFTNVLTQQTGEVYQPQYLSADVYQGIITESMGNGRGGNNAQGTATVSGRPLWAGGNGNGNGGRP